MTPPIDEHSPGIVRAACEAMGCRFEIVITDPAETDGVGFLRAVCEEAIEVIADWHRRLSAFDRGSVVSQLNRDAASAPVRIADDVMALLLACDQVHHASGGAFDITLGPLMRRWGFRPRRPIVPPAAEQPEAVWGQAHVRLDPEAGLVWFDRPGIELDLGGVAKGLALDDAAQVLRDAGVHSAILHGGTSTAIAIGPPPESPSVLIALGPEADAPVIELRDAALSVSAPHGRVIEHEGQLLGHVIDPRNGRPTDSARLAAIVGPSAMRCDAWSTALLVLGKAPDSLSVELSTILCDAAGRWTITGPTSERIRFRRQMPPG